ncbi:MAG TPA: hypothetical protein DCP90_03675 [Clostridiales bacterium]|nr:MAG: hypothetical protein A2Y22_02960 [Clostridiales bacterium GWD2_32_59]HAN09694.1 hypothetical protein [Clostridiales bacterium]
MNLFLFGYTSREKFNPNMYEEYKKNMLINNCNNLHTLDTSLSNTVSPYDVPKFEVYGSFTNTTLFSYNYKDMKQYLSDRSINPSTKG